MKLGEKLVRNLARRNMEAFYCPTTEAATAKVMELMPEPASMVMEMKLALMEELHLWKDVDIQCAGIRI